MTLLLLAGVLILLASLGVMWQRQRVLRREAYIRAAELPKGLFDRLRKRHPGLTLKDCQLVAHGLRQFFLAHLKSGRQFVSMPSQVVDDLWHEFILYTRNYDAFCRHAFGRFLHHTPAVVLAPGRQDNAGLRRCWWYACTEENINPRSPTRLPLLFALDAKLNIAGGFRYVADCSAVRREGDKDDGATPYCAGDFADASVDGSTEGLGDSSGGDGAAGGGSEGGGCGGGGCGGGGGD
jgi:hypothetical protein